MIISEKLNVPHITLEVVTFSENAKEKALVQSGSVQRAQHVGMGRPYGSTITTYKCESITRALHFLS